MYLIKYALTRGVEKVKVIERDNIYITAIFANNYLGNLRLGRDIVETKEEAFQAVYDMREKKIKSLKKQLEKYENFEFTIPD